MLRKLDDTMKDALLHLLRSGSSLQEEAITAVIDLVAEHDATLAESLRKFVYEGIVGPEYLHLGDNIRSEVMEQYIALRILPQTIGVRFGIECALHVLPHFESQYPDECRPHLLVELIYAWLQKSATKVSIRQLAEEVLDIATKLDSELDELFATGGMNLWNSDKRELAYRPLRVLQVLLHTSNGVTLPYPQWQRSLENGVSLSLEAETLGKKPTQREKARKWQLRCLEKLILTEVDHKRSVRRTKKD